VNSNIRNIAITAFKLKSLQRSNGMRISRGQLGAPLATSCCKSFSFACHASGVTSSPVGLYAQVRKLASQLSQPLVPENS
jgi:hypothetical protein